jgi:hypothetical protein
MNTATPSQLLDQCAEPDACWLPIEHNLTAGADHDPTTSLPLPGISAGNPDKEDDRV